MLNWYGNQVMEEHRERVDRALKQYAINQALAANCHSGEQAGALFKMGGQLVRWGQRLQSHSIGAPSRPFSGFHR